MTHREHIMSLTRGDRITLTKDCDLATGVVGNRWVTHPFKAGARLTVLVVGDDGIASRWVTAEPETGPSKCEIWPEQFGMLTIGWEA